MTVTASAIELGKQAVNIYYNRINTRPALEMSQFLGKVFGKKYKTVQLKQVDLSKPGIYVGFEAPGVKYTIPADKKEFIATYADENRIFIWGNDKENLKGTAFAAADFLEKYAGVRFLWPGETGTVADRRKPVTVKPGLDLYIPPFDLRLTSSFHYGSRNRTVNENRNLENWLNHHKVGQSVRAHRGSGFQHAFEKLMPREVYGKEHPEYYSLVSPERWIGEPKPDKPTRRNDPLASGPWQLCTSNPDVRRIIAEQVAKQRPGYRTSISPNDGFGFCECANCVAQDGKPRPNREYGVKDLTNRIYNFAQDVAWQAYKLNPKAKIGMFAYSFFDGVPDGNIKFPPDMVSLAFCYIVSFMDEQEQAALEKTIRGISATGARVFGREYWNTHYFLDYPLSHSRKIARNIKLLKECNATGIGGEPGNAFGPKATDLYILMKMSWNPDLKREDILMDFCKKGFGEKAAPVMYELFEKIEDWTEKLTNNFSKHRGANYHHYDNLYAARIRGMAWCYNEDFQKMCETYYKKALKLADTPTRKERIRFIQRGTRYAQYISNAMNAYSDVAAAGVNMALMQPSGKNIRMEKKNLLKVADAAVKAGRARYGYALRFSHGLCVALVRSNQGNTPRSRPWLFFAQKMSFDLIRGNFNYLVNGAFEYNAYSWGLKGNNGAVLAAVREANHDNEFNFKAFCHAGQGISLKVELPAGSTAAVENLRKISPAEAQNVRFQMFVKGDADPRKYLDVEFAGKKMEAVVLPAEIEDGTLWKELRFKTISVPAGDHTFKITFRNTGKEKVVLYLDDLVLKMKESGK